MATERIIIEFQARGTRTVSRNISKINKSAKSATTILQQMRNVLVVVAAVNVIRRFTALADSMVNLRNRLQATLGGFQAARDAQARLLEISLATRTSLDATGDAFARLALGATDLGLRTETLLGITTTLNKAIILSGASAQEAQNAMIQLSQGIASGALRGDELRAVLEQLPLVARIIADEFDVPLGKLRELGEEGKLTTERLIKAFEKAEGRVAADFADTVTTIDQALANLGTTFTVFIDNLSQSTGASDALVGAINSLGSSFEAIANNLHIIEGLFATLIVAGFLKLVSVIVATRVAIVSWNIASGLAIGLTGGWISATLALAQAQKLLLVTLAANPFLAMGIALAVGIGLLVAFAGATEDVNEKLRDSIEVRKELDKLLTKGISRKSQGEEALDTIATEIGFAKRQVALEELRLKARREINKRIRDNVLTLVQELVIDETALNVAKETLKILENQRDEVHGQLFDLEEKARLQKLGLDFSKEEQKVWDNIQFDIAQIARSERERAAATAVRKAGGDFGAGDLTAELQNIANAARELFDLEEAADAAKDAAKELAKAMEKLADEAKDVVNNSFAAQVVLLEQKLLRLKPFLRKELKDELLVTAALAKARKEATEELREEFAGDAVDFLEERKTLLTQVIELEARRNELVRQFKDAGEADAIALTNEFLKERNRLLMEGSEGVQLADQFFTAAAAARELEQAEKDLKQAVDAGFVSQQQMDQTLVAVQRDMVGASNAALVYEQALIKLKVAADAGAISQEELAVATREARIALLEARTDVSAGVERFFLKQAQDAEDAASQIETVLGNAFSGAEDALAEFITTGKADFSSLADSIIADLARMAIKATTANIIGSIFGSAFGTPIGGETGGAGTAQGLFNTIFGGLSGAAHGADFQVSKNNSIGSLPGVDNRVVAFRARDGEDVHVSKKSDSGRADGGQTFITFNVRSEDSDSFLRSQSQIQNKLIFGAQAAARRR